MEIKELSDDEILNFLMTSDFDDNYSPDELKYLLQKWKYFYRIFNGRYERLKIDNISDIDTLKSQIEVLNNSITSLQIQVADKDNIINSLENRKLTWKERLTGKIITEKNENK